MFVILYMCLFPDMFKGVVGDMSHLGVTESFLVKRQMLLSAAEAAEMILQVDNIIKAEPRYVATNVYCGDWYEKFLHFCLIDPQKFSCTYPCTYTAYNNITSHTYIWICGHLVYLPPQHWRYLRIHQYLQRCIES